ncbi:hypothetical protein HK098_006754 [Nowakowskiella sp. JEL0407]|nr:hypothetical protein HK098_006754 [Nowakowskiella sp. JEL0407]
MNLLRSLGNMMFSRTEESTGILQLPAGQLNYKNSNSKIPVTCLFKDAAATIRRTSTPFNYQLVITRLFEEGEENLEDENEEIDDERSFLLDDQLRFSRSGKSSGPFTLTWVDPEDETERCTYEFLVDPTTKPLTIDAFEQLIYNCMFERRHKKNHADVPDEEMDNYLRTVKQQTAAGLVAATSDNPYSTPVKSRTSNFSAAASPSDTMSLTSTPSGLKSMDVSAQVTPLKPRSGLSSMQSSPSPAEVAPSPAKSINIKSFVPKGDSVFLTNAKLFVFDIRVNQFTLMHDLIQAQLIQTEGFQFWLLIKEDDQTPYISQPIEPRMNPIFNHEHFSFVWVYFDEKTGKPLYSWSLMFDELGTFNTFKEKFGRCIYEAGNKELFSKIKAEEQKYVLDAYEEDVDMNEAETTEDEEESEEELESEEEAELEARNTSSVLFDEGGATTKNSQLTIGFKNDRSFVSRGSRIGVFKHTNDDELEHVATINNVSTLNNKIFTPKKMMLHDQDSTMLLMNPSNQHSIFKMDLEYGKVVEEWNVDDDMQVDDIIPDTKYAQMTPQKTLIGMNHSALFRIDPRLSGKKRVESESKQYATKNKFSSVATTGNGELAVASEKGDIRLYDRIGIRAKTQLPGLGDPIIGIDSTENGKWIVATCKTYLLLVHTEFTDEKSGKSYTGFQKGMGEKSKPVPKRLQLKPEHVAWMGIEVSFTAAHFNTGDDEEKTIVTSTGPYVITWNFRRVKLGKYYDYQIKKYSDNVVADNFRFGQDKAIIVTLPENVEMVNRSVMSTPQKMMKKARDSIVNSPF